MQMNRRKVLATASAFGALLVAGLLRPVAALAATWNKGAFASKSTADAMKNLGAPAAEASSAIVIDAPQIAENGAVVPFTISSRLPKTEAMALLVEKNPNVLVGSYGIPAGTEANVTMRAKMGQTSNVIALVKADGSKS